MHVTRVQTPCGSHIDPPLDEEWPEARKLEWHAAVVAHDTGLPIEVAERAGNGRYTVEVAGRNMTPLDFWPAWTYLLGISEGAQAAHTRDAQ